MRSYIAVTAAALILASCARRETEDITRLEQASLDAWMNKYVTGKGVAAVRQSNGIWVEFIEDGDQTVEAGRDTIVWLKLHYTSTDIEGNVFATRDSVEAMRQRTYSPYTYYVPEYIYCGEANYGLPQGQYFALTNDMTKPDGKTLKLTEGSHVRLYIPSHLAYGSTSYTDDQGYGGQFPLGSNRIVIQDLTVKNVIKNPLTYEEGVVERLATEKWGKDRLDTLAPGFYVDTVNFRQRADLLVDFPELEFKKEYGLSVDSTAVVWYIGRFLPTPEYPSGFIFDTNIPAIHEEFYGRRKNENYPSQSKTFEALSYTPTNDQSSYIAAWYRAIPKLRRGQWSRIVFPSSYGYGATGLSKAVQEQQEYYNTLMQAYTYSSMYGSYYGNYGSYGGYGNYGSSMYDYYNPYNSYYGQSTSTTTEEDKTVVTEIQPYTPLIFEIYIEPNDE